MFLPLSDRNPLVIIPFQIVTVSIIVICVLVFLFQASSEGAMLASVYGFGMIPAVVFEGFTLPEGVPNAPPVLTFVTSMFLHGGWFHLIGNMLYLWVFGDNVEDAMGHIRFLVFYLSCGIAGDLAHGLADTQSQIPSVGASGAISGVLGAYLMLHPRVRVLVLALRIYPIELPAYTVLLIWILLQFLHPFTDPEGEVAWLAHVGGFLAGVVLVTLFKRRDVPLFGVRPKPDAM